MGYANGSNEGETQKRQGISCGRGREEEEEEEEEEEDSEGEEEEEDGAKKGKGEEESFRVADESPYPEYLTMTPRRYNQDSNPKDGGDGGRTNKEDIASPSGPKKPGRSLFPINGMFLVHVALIDADCDPFAPGWTNDISSFFSHRDH